MSATPDGFGGIAAKTNKGRKGFTDVKFGQNTPALDGFGGLFAIKNSDISTAMGQRKTRYLAESGADVVALGDVSCMVHINGLLSRQAQRCRAVHIAQLLNGEVDVEPAPPPVAAPPALSPRRWQDARDK